MRRPARAPLVLLLLVVAVAARVAGWGVITPDVQNFFIPWLTHFEIEGVTSGLTTTQANYNPPYLYFLIATRRLFPAASDVAVIKGMSVAFDLLLAAATAWLVRGRAGAWSWGQAALPAAAVLALPTVVLNAAVWGQADAMYGGFAVLAVVAAERGAMGSAGAAGASSLAFKLQAGFGGPAALALLVTTRHRARLLLGAALAYVVWMMPAVLAGRPWRTVFTTYLRQGSYYQDLSVSAPNVWLFLEHLLPGYRGYRIGVLLGTGATLLACALWLPAAVRRLRQTPDALLEIAFTSYFALPFLLPKMHERYFFMADVLSLALALRDRRWLPVAALVQFGSLCAYADYLWELNEAPYFGIPANAIVFGLLVRHWWRVGLRSVPVTVAAPAHA
jgi:Gpi18-like mannosyltransferase